MDSDQRREWLATLASARPDLVGELGRMLAADDHISGVTQVLNGPVRCFFDGGDFPDRLGSFRLLRRLSEGGMGMVFEAIDESVERRVALKLLRPEHLYFDDARRRFRREAEAIAKLQHPAIVTLLSFGEEQGVPFLAMELVDGVSLAAVLKDVADRSVADLVGEDMWRFVAGETATAGPMPELFVGGWIDVCLRVMAVVGSALHHAHEHGILHRDIKPSNIMLTAGGRVFLLDFGLALSEGDPRLTSPGVRAGSIQYMSPEQVVVTEEGLGPATDVYALGVTLYELVALRPAVDDTSVGDLYQAVASQVAIPAKRLNRLVPNSLQVVLAKSMEKVSSDRYTTALEFADDLRRILAYEPIRARQASLGLRVMRWSQRNRLAAALLVFLMLSSVVSIALFAAAETARANAQRDEGIARATYGILERVLTATDPLRSDAPGGTDVKVIEVLDRIGAELSSFSGHPNTEAVVQKTLGTTYLRLDAREKADIHLRRALALFEDLHGPAHRDALAVSLELALLASKRGHRHESRRIASAAYRLAGEYWPDDPIRFQLARQLVGALTGLEQIEQAASLARSAWRESSAALGENHVETLSCLRTISGVLAQRGQWREAIGLVRELVASYLRIHGPDHTHTLAAKERLSALLFNVDIGETRKLVDELLIAKARIFGSDSPELRTTMYNHAFLLRKEKKFELSRDAFASLVTLQRAATGEDLETADAMRQLSRGYLLLKQFDEAQEWCDAALQINARLLQPSDHRTIKALNAKAHILVARNKPQAARSVYVDLISRASVCFADNRHKLAVYRAEFAKCLSSCREWDTALDILTESHRILTADLGPDNHYTKRALAYIAHVTKAKAQAMGDSAEKPR